MWVSKGCLAVSGWCLNMSGRCLGFFRYKINWKRLNRYHGIQKLLFLPVASYRPKLGVSEGSLDGGWGCLAVSGRCVSMPGRCVSMSGRCVGLTYIRWIEKRWIDIMIFRYYSFSQWPRANQIWGCLKGVWMVSEGVWQFLESVWACLADVWVRQLSEKLKTVE